MEEKGGCVYELMDSPLGEVGIVRLAGGPGSRLLRTLLPVEGWAMAERIRREFPQARPAAAPGRLTGLLSRFLAGEPVDFSPVLLDLEGMPVFVRRVLETCRQIPRGRVTTYGSLAAAAGSPGAARAVGNAMALNPFSLVIPCHRVIASGGALGGFGGGRLALTLKRSLLEWEGVAFDQKGRVLPAFRI